jgi:ABC-type lipoprotein export system ATPase subunit
MAENTIIIEDIKKKYLMGDSRVKVFDGFSLSVSKGEKIALTGPSGSGKTTLLNIIGGLDSPDSGTVVVNGKNISELKESDLAQFRNQEAGFVFQEHLLLPQCNVMENVLLPVLPSSSSQTPESRKQRAEELIKRVGMEERAKHFPWQLSGGEKQRTAVVRALINEPSLILADEPTGSLDKENAESLIELLSELNKEYKTTLILATHSEHLAEIMDRNVKLGE